MKNIIDECLDPEYGCLKNKLGIIDSKELRQAEADLAIVNIHEIFDSNYFDPTPDYLKSIHSKIFSDVYPFAGTYRNIHIEKSEYILAGLSVEYTEPEDIEAELNKIFENLITINYDSLSLEEKVDVTTNLLVSIWKVHPFREGNTRTTLVFLRQFLKSHNIEFSTEFFKTKNNFDFMRHALVSASFTAEDLNFYADNQHVKRVINDIIKSNEVERGR